MGYDLDKYLDEIQGDVVVQEFEPITTGLAISTIAAIGSMVSILITVASIRNSVKVDKKWSKRLNEILETNDWKVHLIPDDSSNAFSVGGKHVFLTSGLIKFLKQREIEAVMLHEVYHSEAKHLQKSIAYKFPFIFMLFYLAVTTSIAAATPILGILIYVMLKGVPDAAYAIIAGKRHEKKADEYAVKYGYGNELESSLRKIEDAQKRASRGRPCGIICKANNKLEEIFDEHPSTAKRIENILRKKRELEQAIKSKSFKKIKAFVMGELKK
jgi:Zn-dependent protease with chaperone function